MDGESIVVANNGKKKNSKTLSKWHGEVGWEATQINGHLEMSGQHASSSYGWMRKVYRQQTLQIVRDEVGAGGTLHLVANVVQLVDSRRKRCRQSEVCTMVYANI